MSSTEQVLGRGDQVLLHQNARFLLVLQAELLVDFITTDTAQIVALRIEEQTLEQRAGVGSRGRISRAQATVNILQRLLFVLGRILLEAFDHDALVHRGVHDLDFGHAQFGDLLDDSLGQRLKRARHHQPLFLVGRIMDENPVGEILELLRFLDREFLDVVKQLENFLIRTPGLFAIVLALEIDAALDIQKGEGAEQGGGQEFPAAFFAVQIHVKQITGVELRFIPGAAVGNDAEAMQQLSVGMLRGFEGDTGRAMQLADHHAFGAIDDKGALGGHQGQFAHEHLFLLGGFGLLLEQEGDVERRAVGQAFAQAFQPVELGRANLVGIIVQHALAIVALDGKHFAEDGFQAGMFEAFFGRRIGLQELPVGVGLQLDHVRRHDNLFDFAEVDTFCGSQWHLGFLVGHGNSAGPVNST